MTQAQPEPLPPLRGEDLPSDPIDLFHRWFAEARARGGVKHPEAMCLSTVDPEGGPEGRIVLLKEVDEGGFVFYTNLESAKGKALAVNPRAALTFYWEKTGRQVRVRGRVERVSDAEADAYFASRPRGSRIGAWASSQSRPLESREALEARFRDFEARFDDDEVPRPPHWSGLRVIPSRIEFWQEAPNRLHDRFEYAREGEGWTIRRLYP